MSTADAQRELDALIARMKDPAPALVVAAEVFSKLVTDSFRNEQAPDGTPWAPNAKSTVMRKRSSKPGMNTGRLRASITVTPDGKTSIRFGTNTKYAGFVQNGTRRAGILKRASYRMPDGSRRRRPAGTAWTAVSPARAFLPVNRDGTPMTQGPAGVAADKVAKIIDRYITTGAL